MMTGGSFSCPRNPFLVSGFPISERVPSKFFALPVAEANRLQSSRRLEPLLPCLTIRQLNYLKTNSWPTVKAWQSIWRKATWLTFRFSKTTHST